MYEIITIDEFGKISAREVYEFLEQDPTHYSRWAKTYIEENQFSEKGKDYEVLATSGENPQGGRPSKDYKLTIDFAKKLCMLQKNERGEQARNYFIEVEKRYDATKQSVAINTADAPILTAVTGFIKEIRRAMEKQGNTPQEISAMIELVCGRYNLPLPKNFVKKLPFEQTSLTIIFEKS